MHSSHFRTVTASKCNVSHEMRTKTDALQSQHALKMQHLFLIHSECKVLTIRPDVSQEPAVCIIMCGCSRYVSASVHIYKCTTSHPRREAATYCRLLNYKYGILEVSCD